MKPRERKRNPPTLLPKIKRPLHLVVLLSCHLDTWHTTVDPSQINCFRRFFQIQSWIEKKINEKARDAHELARKVVKAI
jgi:arginine deiminase